MNLLRRIWWWFFPPCTCRVVALDVHCTLVEWSAACPAHRYPPSNAVDDFSREVRVRDADDECRAIENTYWGS